MQRSTRHRPGSPGARTEGRRPRVGAALLLALAVLAAACSSDDDGSAGIPTSTVPPGDGDVTTVGPEDDPRGELFSSFQESFDRSGPFSGLASFCEPAGEATRRPISVVLVRSAQTPVDPGDLGVGDATRALVDELNDCGGIRRSPLLLQEVVVDLRLRPGETAADVVRAACLEAAVALDAAVVIDPVGIPAPFAECVTVENGTVLLGTEPAPAELLATAEGRLVTLSPSAEQVLSDLVGVLGRRGVLTGRRMGIVVSEGWEGAAAVLEAALAELDRDPSVVVTVGCSGLSACTDGIDAAADALAEEGVDLLIPVLDTVALPRLLAALADRGQAPGIYLTGLLGQASDEAARGAVDASGGAARAYDGALMVDWRDPGAHRRAEPFVPRFDQMCTETVQRRLGRSTEPDDGLAHQQLLNACSLVRLAARGLHSATGGARPGVPVPADLAEALAGLGPVDVPGMVPATLAPFKPAAVDAYHVLVVAAPCDVGRAAICLRETGAYTSR